MISKKHGQVSLILIRRRFSREESRIHIFPDRITSHFSELIYLPVEAVKVHLLFAITVFCFLFRRWGSCSVSSQYFFFVWLFLSVNIFPFIPLLSVCVTNWTIPRKEDMETFFFVLFVPRKHPSSIKRQVNTSLELRVAFFLSSAKQIGIEVRILVLSPLSSFDLAQTQHIQFFCRRLTSHQQF